jgi:hypothetical protein
MGLALSGVGYDDALFVDNGVYTRVRSIARAIERTPELNANYAAGGLNHPKIREFLTFAAGATLDEIRKTYAGAGRTQEQRAPLKGKRGQAFWAELSARGKREYEARKAAGIKPPKFAKVSDAARQAIANILGVGAAYARAAAKKRAADVSVITNRETRGKWVDGSTFTFLPTWNERKAARSAARGRVDADLTGPEAAAERRRAAARAQYGADWYTTHKDAARAAPLFRNMSEAEKQAALAAQKAARKAAAEARLSDVRAYGPYVKDDARKAGTKNKRAATGRGSKSAAFDPSAYRASDIKQATNGTYYVTLPGGKNRFLSAADVAAIRGRANPFGFLGADDFGAVALSNPLIGARTDSTGIDLFDNLEVKASNLPGGMVLGPVAALAAPIAFGVGASAVHLFVVPKLVMPHLPEMVKPFAYTLTGSAVGVAAGLASTHINHRQARAATQMVGGAAALVGVGIDLYRNNFFGLLGGRSSDTAGLALSGEMGDSDDDEGEFGAVALSGDFGAVALSGDFGAVALSGDFGDGGAYQIQPVGADGMFGAVHKHYADAMYGDASVCGPDLSEREGNAALSGVGAFFGTFGQTPQSAMRVNTGISRHAGREGHRWGWLIKLVGWQEFQRITALPPADRCAVIQQMRSAAIEAAKGAIVKQEARLLASHPIEAPEALGPRGANTDYANADAFGALMVAGPGGL